MRKIMFVIAAVLAVGFMLPAQLPNPLNLPDPLGLSRPNPDTSPEPLRQQPRYEEDQKRYKRHYPKKHYKRFHEKRREHDDD